MFQWPGLFSKSNVWTLKIVSLTETIAKFNIVDIHMNMFAIFTMKYINILRFADNNVVWVKKTLKLIKMDDIMKKYILWI